MLPPAVVEGGGVYPQAYLYTDYPWNIAAFDSAQVKLWQAGIVDPAIAGSGLLNACLEPGHLKWKPLWRYGTITRLDKPASVCDLTLEVVTARLFIDEGTALDLTNRRR